MMEWLADKAIMLGALVLVLPAVALTVGPVIW